MCSVFNSLSVLIVLISLGKVEPAPTFITQPSNPSFVDEGSNLTLRWTYNIDGTFREATFKRQISPSAITITAKDSNVVFVNPSYASRTQVAISDSETTVTLLGLNSSESGDYNFEVENTARLSAIANVKITVRVPPRITFITGNQTKNESDTVTLICNATGVPQPTIRWTRLPDQGVVTFTITGEQYKGVYTCTADNGAGNPDSKDVYISVVNFHPEDTNLSTNLSGMIVLVNTSFSLICSARANPPAKYRLYRGQESLLNTTVGQNSVTYTTNVIERIRQVNYSCTPFNFYGDGPTQIVFVTVHYRPSSTKFSTTPSNTTVLRGSSVTLNCIADANPDPHDYWFHFNDSYLGNSSSGSIRAIVKDDGVYTCVPVNIVGVGISAAISVTAVDAPSVQINATTSTVVEGNNIALHCNASGKPKPAIRWIKVGSNSFEVLSNTSALMVVNVSRPGTPGNVIQYQCTASNGVGSPATATANVTVYYPPNITQPRSGEQWTVNVKKSTNRTCVADASPEAAIVWKNSSGILIEDGDTLTFQNATDNDTGHYTCVAANVLGSVDLTLQLSVTRMLQIVSVSTTLKEDSNLDYLENPVTFKEEFERQALLACGHLCTGARVLSLGAIDRGSVTVTLKVNFSTPVTRSEGLAGLINAVNNGTLGPFTVRDFKFLERFDPPTTPTTLPKETTTKSKDDKGSLPWPLIGGVAGGVVFLCFVIGGVTWGVHSRRKCKKDAKIAHDPGSEEQRLQGDEPYAQVNNGYAETGPRSVNSREKAAAVPDYAVVDKSAKKKKKKKQDEEKPPEYAVVDKSKKNKKNEKVDDTYAKVDMSKKTSKKKPRSGEDMLYADLGDFSGTSQMPTVATSPKAQLPPIKRPEPYEGTQYADITQFLKGEATLPIESKQGTELKEKDEKTDEAGGENAPKETPM